MNLHEVIKQYVTHRKSLGERFLTNEGILLAFGRAIGPTSDIVDVLTKQVSTFLAGTGPVTSYWYGKYSTLVGFYRYAVSRGFVKSPPLPTVVPKRPPPFVAYIYSHEELRRLLDGTNTYQRKRSKMEPLTVRTILLLLYGAGLRISEALGLNRSDVDFDESLLTIRETKFYKTRLVPYGPQLREVLLQYATRNCLPVACSADAPFFTTRDGIRVNKCTIQGCFRRICEHSGIRRSDGASCQPRLHDLRHTAAVHRLTSWYRQGLNVQKLLPYLSVYLGHVHLAATQVYLSMTPELLQEAGTLFHHYATAEDQHE